MVTKEDALQVIAESIWKRGEVKQQSLYPSDVSNNNSLYSQASDILEEYFTHYDMVWLKRGETVLIKTYTSEDGLGAVILTDKDISEEYVVKL